MQLFCFWMGGELSAIPRAECDSYSGISHQTHNTETNKYASPCIADTQSNTGLFLETVLL